MKKLRLLLIILGICATVYSSGQTTLSYKFANPRIIRVAGFDNFEFDVQVAADAAGTYLWFGQINLNFDNTTLTTTASQWTVTRSTAFVADNSNGPGNPKYTATKTITGTTTKELNIALTGDPSVFANGPNADDFVEITTSFQTMVTVRGRITSSAGVAGLSFIQSFMNGEQSYVSGPSAFTNYVNPNLYDAADFAQTYVGRIFSKNGGWSQVGGSTNNVQFSDLSVAVNTSLWDSAAIIPSSGVSMMAALRIHNNSVLVIGPNGQVTCTNAEIDASSGLGILSSAAATGSFIDNGTTTVVGTGTAVVWRYMTPDQFHIVSPPIVTQDITLFKFLNSVSKIRDYSEGSGGWNPTLLTSGSFNSGNGYLFFRSTLDTTTTHTAYFIGTPATGDQNVNVTRAANGWNCIGNPFTSAIKATDTGGLLDINTSQLDPSYSGIYVWDEQPGYNGTQQDYKVICNAGYLFPGVINTQLSQNYLQLGQGFFVKPKTGGGTISIPGSLRVHQNTIDFKSAGVSWPAIRLNAQGNNQSSSTIVAFNSYMTKGLDPTYDVGMLKGNPNFALYTRLVEDNGVDFAVQSLPDMESNKFIIPVGVDCQNGDKVTFTAETVNIPANMKVTLQDKQTNTNTRLDLKDAQYTATIAPGSKGPGRFYLVTEDMFSGTGIQVTGNTGINGNDLQKKDDFTVYTIGKTIYIKGEVSPNAKFALYSIDGKLMANFNAGYSNLNQLDGSKFPSRTYILTITDNNKRKSVQFILGE